MPSKHVFHILLIHVAKTETGKPPTSRLHLLDFNLECYQSDRTAARLLYIARTFLLQISNYYLINWNSSLASLIWFYFDQKQKIF